MATHTFTIGEQGSGTDLGEAALRVFKGAEIAITLPDAGTTPEETWRNILAACNGDHKNARNVFVGQSARLTKQKAIKALAKELAPRVELYDRIAAVTDAEGKVTREAREATPEEFEKAGGQPISRADAVALLVELGAGPVPQHTIREEGESKPRSASVKKAIDAEKVRQRDTIRANMATMPDRARKAALENLRALMPEMYELVTANDAAE